MERRTLSLDRFIPVVVTLIAILLSGGCAGLGSPVASKPDTARLYVFDCGTHHIADTAGFGLDKAEVDTADMALACVLISHPKGLLMWDVGAVPDSAWTATGNPVKLPVVPSDGRERQVTMRKPLVAQLAELGYPPRQVTYLALSHYHFDHTANANEFAGSTLARASARPRCDVRRQAAFCDVKRRNTGSVLLSGDLYHYRQSRTLQRVPKFDSNQDQSRLTCAGIESFVHAEGAQLWIQHDYFENAKLKKARSYYD